MKHMKENEKLNTFQKVKIGEYILDSIDNKNPFGSIYLDNINSWNDLKNKNIYLNILDQNFENSLQKIKSVLIENFLKKNYIILRIESQNSSVAFYVNNLPNIVYDEYSIAQILVNNIDFIDSTGAPEFNAKYNLTYFLNDPSKEKNITNTPITNVSSNSYNTFSLDTKVEKPVGNKVSERKFPPVPEVPPGTAEFINKPSKRTYNDALLKDNVNNNDNKKKNRKKKFINYHKLTIFIFVLIFLFILFLIYQYINAKPILPVPNQINNLPISNIAPQDLREIVIITTTEC